MWKAAVNLEDVMSLAKPDPTLTPGVFGNVIVPRDVTSVMKKIVFVNYNIGLLRRMFYTIDHLVPLEIGGTNSIKNLWPQPKKEAKLKDLDENRLRVEIKKGTITMADAQQEILKLWAGDKSEGI